MAVATGSRGPTGEGGQTQMAMQTPAQGQQTQTETQAVLHLRGANEVQGGENRRRIQWAEDVVDNEGMGKKKSKVCCIYHAPKGIDESSDESSSDSSGSDSDSGDDGTARPTKGKGRGHEHGHDHNHGKRKGKPRARSPNAYEKMPKPKSGGTKGS